MRLLPLLALLLGLIVSAVPVAAQSGSPDAREAQEERRDGERDTEATAEETQEEERDGRESADDPERRGAGEDTGNRDGASASGPEEETDPPGGGGDDDEPADRQADEDSPSDADTSVGAGPEGEEAAGEGVVRRAVDYAGQHPIIAGIAMALLVAGIGWGVMLLLQRRKDEVVPDGSYHGDVGSLPNVSTASMGALNAARYPGAVPKGSLEAVVDDLQMNVQLLQAEVTRQREALNEVLRLFRNATAEPPPPTAPPQEVYPQPSRPPSTAEVLGHIFGEWCRTTGMLVNKLPQFADHLRSALPGAAVSPVYRDLDSPARPIVFSRVRDGAAAPAEYWLVETDGERWLLPQPQGPQQFRDLAPAFEGAATPKGLRHFRPALVQEGSGGFVLSQPGSVS